MHLIVSHCTPPSPQSSCTPSAKVGPRRTGLGHVLRHWHALPRAAADEFSLTPPHERALAEALGWRGADGCLPWAARSARLDGIEVADHAWGLVTPVHVRVGSDGVHLADPVALGLDTASSRALADVLAPLFEAEGVQLQFGAPLRWYASHPSLQGLATASLDRVCGRNVDAWLPRQAAARPLRRWQNEAQMLLHAHPLNAAREAAGSLPVNSFWLSGCGVAQAECTNDVRLDERLRSPFFQADVQAWESAWQALDGDAIDPLITAAECGEAVCLTLCGERASASFQARRRPAWRRLVERLVPPPPPTEMIGATL